MMRNADERGRRISRICNTFGPDYSAFLNEIPENERKEMSVCWIELMHKIAKKPGFYDDRNKLAVRTCDALHAVIALFNWMDLEIPRDVIDTCEYMAQDHRTIQQTFTGFVLRMFREEIMGENRLDIETVESCFDQEGMEKYYRFPLI